jgi:hypothetical protein
MKEYGPIKDVAGLMACIREIRRQWPQNSKPERSGEEEELWFRGQGEASWGLAPKLYRPEFDGAQEAEIRQEFQSRALQLVQGRVPDNKWDWYFLMQHYGAPTRLLDWTEHLLVALYFALDGNPQSRRQDAALWVLDPWTLNRSLKLGIDGPMLPDWEEADKYLLGLEDAFSRNEEVSRQSPAAIEPPHVDRRLAAQSSRFVIFGKTRDLTKLRGKRRKKVRLARILISKHAIANLENEVRSYGITVSSLFPDLGGLCREICESWARYKGRRTR